MAKLMAPVWGIGLGRTGTRTLCKALKLLFPEEDFDHNPESIEEVLPWGPGGAEGAVLVHWKALAEYAPGSKFVLTVRDSKLWLDSSLWALKQYPLLEPGHANRFHQIRNRLARWGVTHIPEGGPKEVIPDMQEHFLQHKKAVLKHFEKTPSQLLTIDWGTSKNPWKELCGFLDVPLPKGVEFPYVKDSREDRV